MSTNTTSAVINQSSGNKTSLNDEHLDAIHAAFLVVYALHQKLQATASAGHQQYVTAETSVGEVRLPAIARPSVQVRITTKQVLGAWGTFPEPKVKAAIKRLILKSFLSLNAKNKSEFRKAFSRFKSLTNTNHS